MSEVKKMNAVEIMEYLKGEGYDKLENIKVPFTDMVDCVGLTELNCVDVNGRVSQAMLRLFRVWNVTETVLKSIGIEYAHEEFEDDGIPEYSKVYDQLVEIYEMLPYQFTIEDMIDKAVIQLENEYAKLGQFESKIIDVTTRMIKVVEDISSTIKDKGKLKSALKLIKKELPELGNMISGIKDGVGSKGKDDVSV